MLKYLWMLLQILFSRHRIFIVSRAERCIQPCKAKGISAGRKTIRLEVIKWDVYISRKISQLFVWPGKIKIILHPILFTRTIRNYFERSNSPITIVVNEDTEFPVGL